MELSHPPHHHPPTLISRLSFPEIHAPQIMEQCAASNRKIHVAVGKSLQKATTLLQWTFNHFRNAEIVLIHVYLPSPLIPTLCKFNSLSISIFGL